MTDTLSPHKEPLATGFRKTTLGVAHEVLSGIGSARRLGDELRRRQIAKVLLVHGNSTGALPIFDTVCESLRRAGIAYIKGGRRNPLPMMTDVEELASIVRDGGVEAVVGIGGGSVLDLAKVAAIVAAEGGPAEAKAIPFAPPNAGRLPSLPAAKLPVVAIPTTFSGSETNGNGRIRGGSERFTRSFRDDKVIPAVVVLDPAAGAGQTPAQAVSSALNGLAHCTDALVSLQRSPFSDALAVEGAHRFFSSLAGLARDPAQPESRLDAQWASLLAGMCVRHAYVGLHHALAHAIVIVTGVAHATANAILLPLSIGIHIERLSVADRLRLEQALPANWASLLSEASKAAAIPRTLQHAGAAPSSLDDVAREAMHERCITNVIIPLSEGDVTGILGRAYGLT